MEVLAQAQSLAVEHAFTIGICLLLAVLLAGLVWFSMSGTKSKSGALENKARVNEASTSPNAEIPPQEYVEEMARRAAQEQEQSAEPQGDNTTE
jgi:hypothetical protein